MKMTADLVPLGDGRWRLLGPAGTCCTLTDPPQSLLNDLSLCCQGYDIHLDGDLERALAEHHFVERARAASQVVLIGGGVLAAEVALALAQAGLAVAASAPEAASCSIDPLSQYPSGAAAVRAWVLARHPDARIELAPHWTALPVPPTRLAVIASATVQPDRAITDHLARHGLPYLMVRAHHDCATVGPLVDHSGGACLACLDLALADRDAFWPTTVRVLTTRLAEPDPLAAHWAAAQAAYEARWFLRGDGTTLASSTVEIDGGRPGATRRRWQPHHDCACQNLPPGIVQLPVRQAA